MSGWTKGPWHLCQHLKSVEDDAACRCGYRGVIYGPEHDVAMAICQPGHEPAPEGEEGTEPGRYDRATELANAHLIAAAPDLYEALAAVVKNSDDLEASGRPRRDMKLIDLYNEATAALAKANPTLTKAGDERSKVQS